MQFVLSIATDNAAFVGDHPFGDATNMEVARILHELADRVEGMGEDAHTRDETDPFVLMDVNGASVGRAYFEDE